MKTTTAEKLFLSGSFIQYVFHFVWRKKCFSFSQAYLVKNISVLIASDIFLMLQLDQHKTN